MLLVQDLDFSYQQEKTLSNISFQLNQGQFGCLLGPNGSGKTTILKCLNGILRPARGQIKIDGREIGQMNRREIAHTISMVPQEHYITFTYQVIDLIAMGGTPYLSFGAMPGFDLYQQAEEIMEELNIIHLAGQNYNEISGGERQLVLIARALLQDTRLIILDEPTAHLDFKNTHLLLQIVKRLTTRGVTVLTAIHDPNLALKFADQVILLKNGHVLAAGSTEDSLTEVNLEEIYGIKIISHYLEGSRKMVIPEME